MKRSSPSNIDYGLVFEASPNACLLLSPDLRVIGLNQAYLTLVEMPREHLIGRRLFDVFPAALQDAANELQASFTHVIRQKRPHIIPLLRYPVEGSSPSFNNCYWMVRNSPLLSADGDLIGILNCPINVTDIVANNKAASNPAGPPPNTLEDAHSAIFINKQLADERQHLRHLMQQAPGFSAIAIGPQHIFEIVNNAYYQLVGHRELVGKSVREALPELEGQGFFELLDNVYRSGQPFIGRAMPIQLQAEVDGELMEHYIDFIYQPILDEYGKVSGIFAQGHDVTEAHKLALTVSYQAAHDALTGLVNRREFENRLTRNINALQNRRCRHSLLYMDIDQFKVINDTCGHAAGDEMLCQVSMQISSILGDHHTIARLGGDEFGILLENVGAKEAQSIAETLRQSIEAMKFCRGQRVFGCSASFGVVTFGQEIGGVAEVLTAADSACFLAKERGRNRVEVYCPDDHDLAARRREMDWVTRLREALAESRILLYAQHIKPLAIRRDETIRLEILIRMLDTDGTLVSPMSFIPAAERYGFMRALDHFVIQETFARVSALPSHLRSLVHLSINLSGTTLSEDTFVLFVQNQLDRNPYLTPNQICFEITETAALNNLSHTASRILEMRQQGFKFALDDFGSGMSSMRYLRQLPVDYLKIDGAFIRNIAFTPEDEAIVDAIARIASVMGIQTVAEYVDSEAAVSKLKQLDIDYVQGFYIRL